MKKYNLFCLKNESHHPALYSISEQLNEFPVTRKKIFDSIFVSFLPTIELGFKGYSSKFLVSIDRTFFSPFNSSFYFKKYAFYLRYIKDVYPFIHDKTPVARIMVDYEDYSFHYVFFVKEVCHE